METHSDGLDGTASGLDTVGVEVDKPLMSTAERTLGKAARTRPHELEGALGSYIHKFILILTTTLFYNLCKKQIIV